MPSSAIGAWPGAATLPGCGRATAGAMMQAKGGVLGDLVRWSDDADEMIRGDLTTAAAYLTLAGGTVVTAAAPCGLGAAGGRRAGVHDLAGLRPEAGADRGRPACGAGVSHP